MTSNNIKPAFTLLELLVVMAILAILVGLLLAAVQTVRQSAAKVECQNRLRQIGLAFQQFHDANRSFPSGHRSYFNRDLRPLSGWGIDVLPYLEQSSVQDQALADFQRQFVPFGRPGQPPHVGLSTVIPAFLCPSDGRIRTAQVSKVTNTLAAFTSYLGVAGQNDRANDGVLFRDSRVRLMEITDGSSSTLLRGERPPSADYQFGWWYAGAGQRGRGTADMTLSVCEPNLQPILSGSTCGPGNYPFRKADGFDDPCGMFHFWSPHARGAHFAFCDGSVRFLNYSANDILPALATRAGGEMVAVE